MEKIVFLWGFMGVGKTRLGLKLASLLNVTFVDLDDEIIAKADKSISEIFIDHGEAFFRELEMSTLDNLITKKDNGVVIACGGGTPCHNNNAINMLDAGAVVHITCAKHVLAERLLRNRDKRPLLADVSNLNEMLVKVNELGTPRNIYYNLAHFEIDNTFPDEIEDELNHLVYLLNNH